jgi:hypothetical protein
MSRPPRWMIVATGLGALALGLAAAWFYLAQRNYLEQTARTNLSAGADSYVEAILAWRAKRLSDAVALQGNPAFNRNVARWLAAPGPENRADILSQLRNIRDSYGYLDVLLADQAGRVRLAASGRPGGLDPEGTRTLSAAFQSRRPAMTDVHWSPPDSIPHVAVVAPLFAPGA